MIIILPEPFDVECEVGFEPTNTGFADLPLKPLGHSHILSCGRWNRTTDYKLMRLVSYHCCIPHVMVGAVGLEPTKSLDGRFFRHSAQGTPVSCDCRYATPRYVIGRSRRARTPDFRFWRPTFYRLNYTPMF